MLENSNISKRSWQESGGIPRPIFIGVVLLLFGLQLFVTFGGLSSPMAMDQAQVARAISRGEGFKTQVIRPYAWRQMLANEKDIPVTEMKDSSQPPLPSLVLAPVFKVLSAYSECTPSTSVYAFDRVTAGISLMFFMASMVVVYLIVERLFDVRIASWTLVMMALCEWLWNVATSGLSHMMVLFFFSCSIYLLVLLMERSLDGRRGGQGLALSLGISITLMLFSHWLSIWLIFGIIVGAAFFVTPRRYAAVIAVVPLLALVGWAVRNYSVSGDLMGASKSVVQSIFSWKTESILLRDFSGAPQPIFLSFVIRKLEASFTGQFKEVFSFFGLALPALLFFPALLHPFKRAETSNIRWVLGIVWAFAAVGMLLNGLPEGADDDQQLHHIFIPLFGAYGLAFTVVLWSRLSISRGSGWLAQHGVLLGACVITALPLLAALPGKITQGLILQGKFSQWPPYLPDRLARLKEMVNKNEVLISDMPWAVAWYADRSCIWLPLTQEEVKEMTKLSATHQRPIAGMIFTPWSARGERFSDAFSNEYSAWSAHVMRGMGVGLGLDTMIHMNVPFKEFYPLAGTPVGEGRFIAEMVFMADRKRWEATGK